MKQLRTVQPKLLVLMGLTALCTSALATKGRFTVIKPDGTTLQGNQKTTLSLKAGERLKVKGVHVEFEVNGDSLSIENLTMTGADANPATNGKRVRILKCSKVMGAKFAGGISLELKNDTIVLKRMANGTEAKIQAKDRPSENVVEIEADHPVEVETEVEKEFHHVIGDDGGIEVQDGEMEAHHTASLAVLKTPKKNCITGTRIARWTVQARGSMGMFVGKPKIKP